MVFGATPVFSPEAVILRMFLMWQGKKEGCPFPWNGFSPDFAAMALNDSICCRQADTEAGDVAGTGKALKGLEKPAGFRHVKTDAIVGDSNDKTAIFFVPGP